MRNIILIAFISFCMLLSSFSPLSKRNYKIRKVVIDAGHGGKDPGCHGKSAKEAEVALKVALEVGKLVSTIEDVKVIYTRDKNEFIELHDRAGLANKNNADLFISIHCNADGKPVMIRDKKTGKLRAKTYKNKKGKIMVVEVPNPEPYGASTYVMGLKNEMGQMKVAQRENSVILLEDDYQAKYQGFDPDSEESYIIMSNYTSGYVINSASFAIKIQDEYFKKAGRVDKGVHRQSIWVLWRTAMPSILTEIGYLTNPQEEKFLSSEKGQEYMASCLFRAFRKYKDEQEGNKKNYNDELENQKALEKEIYVQPIDTVEEAIILDKPEEPKDVVVKDNAKTLAEQKAKAIADSMTNALTTQLKKDAKDNEAKTKNYNRLIMLADLNFRKKNYTDALTFYKDAEENNVNHDKHPSEKIKEIESIISTVENKPKTDSIKLEKITTAIVFKVQFASNDKEVDAKTKYTNVTEVSFYKVGVVYKYTSGNYKTFEDATKQQAKLRELGYKDCFVAAFKNGARMDINEARKVVEGKK